MNPWDDFIRDAKKFSDPVQLDREENDYKVDIGKKLKDARKAVLNSEQGWEDLVKKGLSGNLIFPIMQARFRAWIDDFPADALTALKNLWARDMSASSQRIRTFKRRFPANVISGAGTRMNLISVLLMGLDVKQYPPFRVRLFSQAYLNTGYKHPVQRANEETLYQHALGFLDRFIDEASKRDLTLRHRLDAQSLLWKILQSPEEAAGSAAPGIHSSENGQFINRFLVQVSPDIGYLNITESQRYQNYSWKDKPRDSDHGEVKPGDELLVYCTGNVPRHGMSLAFSTEVKQVSSDKITFDLEDPREFKSPLSFQDIRALVGRGEIGNVFNKCGLQGFNISMLEHQEALQILQLLGHPTAVPSLEDLAKEIYLPFEFLEEINSLLNLKPQVIFQGPPGTGKTFVAQRLARCLAGSKDRVELVQFHPSYAYEDFIQGFRPKLVDGQPSFVLRDGPLKRAADRARKENHYKHFLVIDEINRGNLSKVFGELYYMLEDRDEEMNLQYSEDSDDKFSLPKNLYIIGTMNTTDRSIALVDMALRRRFNFVEFYPDKQPIKGLLRSFLSTEKLDEVKWIADVVDLANKKFNDSETAIGPSYFMRKNLTKQDIGLIWEHNVLPYIKESLYGQVEDRIGEFALDKLRSPTTTQSSPPADSSIQNTDNEPRNEIDNR